MKNILLMIKFLERYKIQFSQGMMFLVIVSFYGSKLLGKILTNVFSLNQTVGWKIQISNTWIDDILYLPILVYVIVYLILANFKIRTNLFLSAIHFLLLAVCGLCINFWELDLRILLFFTGMSIIVFALNVYTSLKENSVFN